MQFYNQKLDSVIEHFNSNAEHGLDDKSIELGWKKYGKNILHATNSRTGFTILFDQFTSPLVIILIVASLLSFYLNQPRDGSILLVIVLLNSLIGFYQEWKSENILASLKNLVVNKSTVIRNGKTVEIFAEDLIPGDIVKLYEGDGVPADIRLINSNSFSTNEFILTGESLPSSKDYSFTSDATLAISDTKNCIYMGTTVARGEATGIVYATGAQTEIGKISSSSQKIKATNAPVQTEIVDVAKKLTYATLIIGVCLFGTRLFAE